MLLRSRDDRLGDRAGEGDADEEAPAAGSKAAAPEEIEAKVVKVGAPNASGAVVIQVAVASTDSAQLAARAATGRVAIVLSAKG